MGIHNEEGFGRVRTDLPGLIHTLLKQLLDTSDKDRGYIEIGSGEHVILMANNLGGLSQLEMGAVTAELSKQLSETYGINAVRVLSGTYMSSLNGLGFSATLLKVVDNQFVELLDMPAAASGWLPPAPAETWAREKRGDIIDMADSQFGEERTRSNLQGKFQCRTFCTIVVPDFIDNNRGWCI